VAVRQIEDKRVLRSELSSRNRGAVQ
jgi:hypothetical protein